MKKLLAALAFLAAFGASEAEAAICAGYPFTLQNGQTADANQVMSNFNNILNCANNSLFPNSGGTITGTLTVTGLITGQAGLTVSAGVVTLPNGNAAAPALNFGDPTTGLFRPANNAIGFANGGTENARLDTNGVLTLGVPPFNVPNLTVLGLVIQSNTSSGDELDVVKASGTSNGVGISGAKARGTIAAPTTVSNNDNIVAYQGFGFSGGAYDNAAQIVMQVDAAPSTTTVPGRIKLSTATTGGTLAQGELIDSGQDVFLGSGTQIGQNATNGGFTYITTMAASPTQIPAGETSGFAAMVVDALGNLLYRQPAKQWQQANLSRFTSTPQGIPAAGNTLTVAHALGATPAIVSLFLQNVTPEQNYNVGDTLQISSSAITAGGNSLNPQVFVDATNVNVIIPSTEIVILNKTTGAAAGITLADWKIIVDAFK
ncbi:MAG TPA: hypothetical protein VEU47_19055 [Candidatus Cybelea sp.]|nr:hypothetical protein [Candidatus Cybelea sp.]